MITLNAPLILPAPLSETLVNATLVTARLDLHNRVVELVYAYGNYAAQDFAPSTNLPGINVSIHLSTGAVYVRGDFKGWVAPNTLVAIQRTIENFVKGSETLATGITITLPNSDGSKSANTAQVALLPGTIS